MSIATVDTCVGRVLVAGEGATGVSPVRSFMNFSSNLTQLQSDPPLAKDNRISTTAINYLREEKLLGKFLFFGSCFGLEMSGKREEHPCRHLRVFPCKNTGFKSKVSTILELFPGLWAYKQGSWLLSHILVHKHSALSESTLSLFAGPVHSAPGCSHSLRQLPQLLLTVPKPHQPFS